MKTMRIKQPLCALSLALLMAAPFTACSNDEANEPQPNTGKIVLNPQLGAEAWKDAAAGTRAVTQEAVELAAEGKLTISLYETKVDNGQTVVDPSAAVQTNIFTVSAGGNLELHTDNTAEALTVSKPGEYMIAADGLMNFTASKVPFIASIRHKDVNLTGSGDPTYNLVTITTEGKLVVSSKIVSAGIRLNLKNADGQAYTGDEVTVSCPLLTHDEQDTSKETKTLGGTDVTTGIWGNIKVASIATDTELFTIKETVGATPKTYKLKYNGASNLTLKAGQLYTFNVRVGGTELVLEAPTQDTIKDFETGIDSSNDADGNGSIDADLKRDTQNP